MKKFIPTILFTIFVTLAVGCTVAAAKHSIEHCDYIADGNPKEFRECIGL